MGTKNKLGRWYPWAPMDTCLCRQNVIQVSFAMREVALSSVKFCLFVVPFKMSGPGLEKNLRFFRKSF